MKLYPSICLISVLLLAAMAGCNKPSTSPTSPAGTWKVTYTRDGKTEAYQPTLKLKKEGDMLTGTFTRRRGQQDIEMALEDVKVETNEISFMVSISGNGITVVRKYHGKIAGDTMTDGTVEESWNGQDRSGEHPIHWEAERVKE